MATWMHRVTPDVSLPRGASPYRVLFDRELCSYIDVIAPAHDGASFGQELERIVEEQHHIRKF